MVISTQFQDFDPISGYVPDTHFSYLPEIAERARAILIGKTADQINSAEQRINSEIEIYFSEIKYQEVDELTVKFYHDPECYKEYFEWDGGSRFNGRWIYRNQMDEYLGIPTAGNTSEVDALKTIIENRDISIFSHECYPIQEPDHWREGRTHELFAVLALRLIAYCISWTGHKQVCTNRSIAGECALKAMDAVCFAEHMRDVEWLGQFHKKYHLQVSAIHNDLLGKTKEKIRADLMAEQIAHERTKQTTRSEQLSAARHRGTKDARELVCKEWEAACNDFPSAEKAGIHYADWLENKSIGYPFKGTTAFFQPRAVAGWIREHAKEKGIKLR